MDPRKSNKNSGSKSKQPQTEQPPQSPQQLFPNNLGFTQFSPIGLSQQPLFSPQFSHYPNQQFYPPQFQYFQQPSQPPFQPTQDSPCSTNQFPIQTDYNRFTLRDESSGEDDYLQQHQQHDFDEESEEVEEVAPIPKSRAKGKGKKKASDDDNAPRLGKRIPWTITEEEHLFDAFISCSENPIDGRDLARDSFWLRVTGEFHKRVGVEDEYRTRHCIYSKYRDMIKDLGFYMSQLNNFTNNRRSGWAEKDIRLAAKKAFKSEKLRNFRYEHLVDKALTHPKWMNVPSGPGRASDASKRTKNTSEGAYTTSSDGATGPIHTDSDSFDLNKSFADLQQRPTGKKKASRLGRTSVSSVPNPNPEVNEKWNEFLKFKQMEADLRKKKEKRKQEEHYLKLMSMDLSKLPPDEAESIIKLRKMWRDEHNL